jgi:glycosyltransferase involved in cell wall biosynthesis
MSNPSLSDVLGKHAILGTVEKDGKVYILFDLDEKSGRSASYSSGGVKRFVDLIPADFEDYKKYKNECQKKIGLIKKERKKGRVKTKYVFSDGEEVDISAKKPVIDNFLNESRMKEFMEMVSKKAKATPNVHDAVTEDSVMKFFNRDKKLVFDDLRKIKSDTFSHDREWKDFLERKGLSLAVIMPTYNESNFRRNIQLVGNVRNAGLLNEIIITDGYSTRHEPSEVLRSLSRKGKKIDCTVIRQNGAGKGEAIESAVKYALTQGHDFCIIVDSDNMPALSRVFPDAPVDINIEFFVRRFIKSIIDQCKKRGIDDTMKTFFKASYMRMPQLKKSFQLRFGIVTRIVKDFYDRSLGSRHNLYALSGEVAFNPKFLLENLSLDGNILKISGMLEGQYCGSNVPGGFCLETVWNSIIDINNYDVCYVNTYLHHHGPVIKSTKTDIGEQIGEVLTGTFAGILTALIYSGDKSAKNRSMLKRIPLEVIRPRRLILSIGKGKIKHTDIR